MLDAVIAPVASSASISIRFSNINTVARVETTHSLAIKPVTAAAASCQSATPTMGAITYAIGVAMVARMESAGSSTARKFQP